MNRKLLFTCAIFVFYSNSFSMAKETESKEDSANKVHSRQKRYFWYNGDAETFLGKSFNLF